MNPPRPSLPTVTVVIRTRNECERLRLTLASLESQSLHEVVVVDDCSDDATPQVVEEAAANLPLVSVRNARNRGRSGASNLGAQRATGDVLMFLDGDTLTGPQCIALHAAAHARDPALVGRGETMHLRCTRFLQDPEAATPRAGEQARLDRMPAHEREKLRVTREQVRSQFGTIHVRAEYGIYPGAGPRALHELEVHALRSGPACGLLWAAAVGSNLSVRRDAFLAAGGFDEALTINEHRELALRLTQEGHHLGMVEGAYTYHMTHRSGWRDPLQDREWEAVFYRRHPLPAVKMLAVFWAGLSDARSASPATRIGSLAQLDEALRTLTDAEIDALRTQVPGLQTLGAAMPEASA